MGESPDRVERNEDTDGVAAQEGVNDDVDMGEFERDLDGTGVADARGSEDVGNDGERGELGSPQDREGLEDPEDLEDSEDLGDLGDLGDRRDETDDRADVDAPAGRAAAEDAAVTAQTPKPDATADGDQPPAARVAPEDPAPVRAAATDRDDTATPPPAPNRDPAAADADADGAADGDRAGARGVAAAGDRIVASDAAAGAEAAADADGGDADAPDAGGVGGGGEDFGGGQGAAPAGAGRSELARVGAVSGGAGVVEAGRGVDAPTTALWSPPERVTQALSRPVPPLPAAAPAAMLTSDPATDPATDPEVVPGVGPGVVPGQGPEGGANPETTSEALEILATLSRRPMTPLRRALKRVGLWGGLLCFLLAIAAFVQVLRPLPAPVLKLTAASSYTFAGSAPTLDWPTAGQSAVEVDGLGSLGDTGPEKPVPIASVTKVMTAHLVLKDHPLNVGQQGPVIVVDQQAVDDYTKGHSDGESVMKVSKGEKLTEYQALQMLLIPSANNVARLLGRWDAGTDAAFVARMQAEAAALGMTQTTYTDPSGLLDTTKSTANDQLKLAKVAIETPVFRQIVSTTTFSPPENGPTPNTNALIGQDGVIGIKTGSDSAALGCLMWAARTTVGGTTQTILGVTLGQPALSPTFGILDNVMATSKKLLVSAEHVLQSQVLVKQGQVVGYVDDGEGGRTPLAAAQDVNVVGWSGTTVPVSLTALGGVLPHTGKAGEAVGYLVVGSGASAQRIPVTLQSDLAEPSYGARLTRLG